MRIRRLLTCLLLFAAVGVARAAETPPPAAPATKPATQPGFEAEIAAFEAADREHPPALGSVVFVGSSSIRLWKTLAADFPGVPVLNRGFGGSMIPDSVRYARRIILPYKPRLVLFYAGDNDINAGHSAQRVAADFKVLAGMVRKELPDTKFAFISIKPSPSRWKLADEMREANRLIREFTAADPKLGYVDVFGPMLGADGMPREELYVADKLHMTPAGYEIWTKILRPLVDEYKTAPAAHRAP